MLVTKVRAYCQYRVLANGVHEFIMQESSRAAVDDFIDALEEMVTLIPPGTAAPMLLNSVVGIQPISYIFGRVRDLTRKYPPPPPGQRSKIAMMFKPNILIDTIDMMMRSFPNVKVRFFKPDEREAALAWLIEP